MKEAIKVFLKIFFITTVVFIITAIIAAIAFAVTASVILALAILFIATIVGVVLCFKLQKGLMKKIISIIAMPYTFIVPLIVIAGYLMFLVNK